MKPSQEPDQFPAFWSIQLRKEGKLDAMKAWRAAIRDFPARDIIEGYKRLLPFESKKEPHFRKMPATWLRAGCWMDELPVEKSTYVSPVVIRHETAPLDMEKVRKGIKSKFMQAWEQRLETSH